MEKEMRELYIEGWPPHCRGAHPAPHSALPEHPHPSPSDVQPCQPSGRGPADQKSLRYALKAAGTGSSSPSATLFYELEASSSADVGPDGDRQILIPPR